MNVNDKRSFHSKTDCRTCEDQIKKEVEEEIREDVLLNIVHEIRNPLMHIGGLVINLRKKVETGKTEDKGVWFPEDQADKIIEFSKIIAREVKGLEDIVTTAEDFFLYKKLNLKNVNLNDLMEKVAEAVNCDKRVRTEFVFNLERKILVDPIKIRMLIMNLMINAREVIFESNLGKEGVIKSITGCDNSDGVFFEIKNNGRPIPHDHVEKIFDPLFTTKSNGSGRGLAISKAIVKAHKGKIVAKNLEDGWVSFRANFPLS